MGDCDVLRKEIDSMHDEDDMCIMGNLKNVQLIMYANELADKPHIHFINLKTGEEGALSLQTADYYDHDNYNGRLNNELLKEIYDYCCSACPINDKVKNFDFICVTWAKVNKNCAMPKNAPRYDLINKR